MRKIIAITLITMLFCSNIIYAAATFSDLRETHWAFRAVSTLVDRGGISGYPDGTFKPSGTITIAEFVKITVGVTLGSAEKTGDHWASGYFDKAQDAGLIIAGEINKAEWNTPITRQQIAVIIARVAKMLGENITAESRDAIIAEISDFTLICEACKDSVIDVYSVGIITGYPDGTFKGTNTATRAEASSMLVRMLDKSQRVGVQTVKIRDYISNWDDEIFEGESVTYKERFGNLEEAVYIQNTSGFNFSSGVVTLVAISADVGLFKSVGAAIISGEIVEIAAPIDVLNGRATYRSKFRADEIEYFFSYSSGYKDAVIFPNPLFKGD